MTSFCFSADGKSPFTCYKSQATNQITLNYMFFECVLVKLNIVIFFILILSLTYVLNVYCKGLNTKFQNVKVKLLNSNLDTNCST